MPSRTDVSLALAVVIAVSGSSAPALAQSTTPAITWDVPCGERWTFAAGVAELGGSLDGFEVSVGVAETEAGTFRGRLGIARAGEALAERELEDASCADVVDALVIAAALALRALPAPPPAPPARDTTPIAATDDETPPRTLPTAPPTGPSARVGLGASLRGGVGPTPGLSLAPALGLVVEVERVIVGLDVAFWPDAAATLADGQRGVALWALTSGLSVGYRVGDGFSIVPCAVLEATAAVARGIGVPSPRSEATFVLDVGASVALALDFDPVRIFVRGDVLFGLVQPAYGVEGERVFVGPTVRGTGGAGVLVFF